jgi:Protein of unknown function DUF262
MISDEGLDGDAVGMIPDDDGLDNDAVGMVTLEEPGGESVIDLAEADEVIPLNYEITSYGADYPVDGLVKRLENGDITVPRFSAGRQDGDEVVGFQREYVWSKTQADRFIESLLLGLPIPGIFLVRENDGRLLVLDGHQRLQTLKNFYEGIFKGRSFKLVHVQDRFKNLTYKDLEAEDRRRLDNSIIHATIVKQDEPTGDQSSVYLIFERLNSGGTILQPQEIRVALYHGPFADLLVALNEYPAWRQLFGKRSQRLKDLELIQRFLGLFYYGDHYARPMKAFLNRYMATNRQLQAQSEEELTSIFVLTVDTIIAGIGPRAFKPSNAVNAAVLDSVMVGVASRIVVGGELQNPIRLLEPYRRLLANPDYIRVTSRSTADDENVALRLELARDAFLGVK